MGKKRKDGEAKKGRKEEKTGKAEMVIARRAWIVVNPHFPHKDVGVNVNNHPSRVVQENNKYRKDDGKGKKGRKEEKTGKEERVIARRGLIMIF